MEEPCVLWFSSFTEAQAVVYFSCESIPSQQDFCIFLVVRLQGTMVALGAEVICLLPVLSVGLPVL